MVSPALLALTTTPSMAPSLADDTWPERATGACALAVWVVAKQNAARVAAVKAVRRVRICDLPRGAIPGNQTRVGKAKRAHRWSSGGGGHGAILREALRTRL